VAGYFITALAAAGLVTASVAATGSVRSGDALPVLGLAQGAAGAGKCGVRVIRTGTPGAADIVREQLADGSCVCVVTTGPASNNGSAEGVVTNLLRDGQCNAAPAANNVGGEVAGAGASGGGAGAVLPVLLGAVGAGGLAAGLGAASNG